MSFRVHSFWLRLLPAIVLSCPLPAAVMADLALRYVNSEVITMGDVVERNSMRIGEAQRRGQPVPEGRNELVKFSVDTLTQLTEESLLVQRAKELGFTPDRDEIRLEVMQLAKERGLSLSLRDQSSQRRLIERQRTIDIVLGWFESKLAMPQPSVLLRSYEQHRGEFDRPARAKVLQILLRSTPPEVRAKLADDRRVLLRSAQDASAESIKRTVNNYLNRYLEAAAGQQDTILAALASELAVVPVAGLEPVDAALVERAILLGRQASAMIDEATAVQRLETARMQLVGLSGKVLDERFRTLGKELGTVRADLGWIEPGTLARPVEQAAFTAPVGNVLAPFVSNGVACLMLVSEREDARSRGFDEVIGELDAAARKDRRTHARSTAVAILRTKASIRDVRDLGNLVE